ncbi:MAG: hypothetical protein KBD19_02020 [Candidatus Moranbacteria bacterium]|nr:hypothetical protein [Candidatus Moranbacteria bacterium]
MLDVCDRCVKRAETFRRITLILKGGCRTVRCPEEDCFTLWCLDPEERTLLRKVILESETEIVSFPGANALPCLFGTGEDKKIVKNGMVFVPPSWFREKPGLERIGREGLCYQAYFIAAKKRS